MNRKNIRTIIISALVLLVAIVAILNINIEPAQKPTQSSVVSSPVEKSETPEAEVDTVENEQPEQEQPEQEQNIKEKTENTPTTETKVEENKAIESTKQENTQSVPADTKTPEPVPSQPEQHFCTLEIRCDTVVDTSKLENQAVAPYVPKNGVILATAKIEFTPGESVFDVLLRATKERNIHMEFRDDNLYSGKYIEGINYLYEFDGGALSGWMYKVNGKFPNYGCAAYKVKDGDAIVWMYTCDLGVDVGDNSTW